MQPNLTTTEVPAHLSEVSPDPSTIMPGSQTTATATSARDNLPVPRDLNQSFQRSATQQTTNFESPEVLQQRITELERALTSMVIQQNAKDHDIQILQATVQHLEADVFDDIDADDIHTQPDENLHSQPW